ncbi:MAG: hypothetical protein IK108_12330, partial [Clostridia bacterium]|nr:hypothetical protein [Clostridia bacterium]
MYNKADLQIAVYRCVPDFSVGGGVPTPRILILHNYVIFEEMLISNINTTGEYLPNDAGRR